MSLVPKSCDLCGFFGKNRCLHDHGKGVDIGDGSKLPKFCPLKDDILEATRFKVRYRTEPFYLMVVEREGKPWEVFVEHAVNRKPSLQFMLASWDCNTRFISRDLKREPLESTIRQLTKSSRQKNDLPYIIAEKLKEWL